MAATDEAPTLVMPTIDETLTPASMAATDEAPTLVMPTIDETLTSLRFSLPDPDPSIPGSTKETLERKCQVLVDQSSVLLQHEENLNEAITKFNIQIQQIENQLTELRRLSMFPDALVNFVSLLEVANQYFEFIESARQVYDFERRHSTEDIRCTLLQDQQLTSKFNKLGETEISDAARAIFWDVYDEEKGTKNSSQASLDWIYKLVYKARVKGYVMDQDPSAELEKMMKFEPYVYDCYFLFEELPVKCTKKLTEEARKKYSQLVSTIHAKYKEPKLTSTATSARKLTPTGAGIKGAFNEKHRFTSTVITGAGIKGAFNEKHGFTSTTTGATSATNKETFGEQYDEFTSTAITGAGIKEASTAISATNKEAFGATSATNKETFGEQCDEFTPTATSARNKATLGENPMEKRKLIPTATSARYKETFGEKHKLTFSEAFVGSDRNKENDKCKLIFTSTAKRPFEATGATGKIAKAKVMLSRGNCWAPVPPQAHLGHY